MQCAMQLSALNLLKNNKTTKVGIKGKRKKEVGITIITHILSNYDAFAMQKHMILLLLGLKYYK